MANKESKKSAEGRKPNGSYFVAFRSAKGQSLTFFRGAKDDYRSPRL
jgi:hypothetical protein